MRPVFKPRKIKNNGLQTGATIKTWPAPPLPAPAVTAESASVRLASLAHTPVVGVCDAMTSLVSVVNQRPQRSAAAVTGRLQSSD